METKDLISLAELAKEIKETKSKLNYYTWMGLLRPIKRLGHTMIFSKKETLNDLKFIRECIENGDKLADIACRLKANRKK